jgi:hypothetical protein
MAWRFLQLTLDGLICLQLSLVRCGNKPLESQNLHLLTVLEMFIQSTAGVEVAESPTVSSKHEVSFLELTLTNCLRKTNDFERDFLLGGSTDLLPFERHENSLAALFSNSINLMSAPANPFAYFCLNLIGVPPTFQRREDHRFQNSPSARVATHAAEIIPSTMRADAQPLLGCAKVNWAKKVFL